jgi:thiol-disulfide isomerase/thioredoxin
MIKINRIITLFSLVFAIGNVQAQQSSSSAYPVIGKPCPDFMLRHVKYYTKTDVSLSDLKGKWLVLDFFTSECGACIASFPRISADAKQFAGQLTYMMVGAPDVSIGPLYERFREKLHMPMPCAFDHSLFDKWAVHGVPRVFLIDDKGIVRSISTGLTSEQLKSFITGKGRESAKLAYSTPDSTIIYGSAFSYYNPKIEQFTDPVTIVRDSTGTTTFACKGNPLSYMLNYAFWGDMVPAGYHPGGDSSFYRYANKSVIETKDSALFDYSTRENRNVFDYLLRVNGDVPDSALRAMMRDDLCKYFGWQVEVETRRQACWALVATDEARHKLQSNGGHLSVTGNQKIMDFTAINYPFDQFFRQICDEAPHTIILDRTGITGNIDFTVKGPWLSIADIQAGLQALGLRLVPTTTQMKVLVVKNRLTGEINETEIAADQPRPVQFEHMNWRDALNKAKTTGKLVMVYGYDPADADCQAMNKNILSTEVLGDYLSSRVVALKYDLSDHSDTTAQKFKEQYHIHTYPAFLFFSPGGKPLDISVGWIDIHGLMNLAAQAGNPRYQYFTQLDAYRAGRVDSAFLYQLAIDAMDKQQPVSRELAWAYIRRYLLPAAQASRWDAGNYRLLNTELIANADTAVIDLIYDNRKAIDEANHDPQMAEDRVGDFVIDYYGHTTSGSPDWQLVGSVFDKRYPAINYHRKLLERQVAWYLEHQDWKAYQSYIGQLIGKYQNQMDWNQVNERCWDIFLYADDPVLLQNAIGWTQKVLKDSNQSPDVLETYAELLYKTKSKLDYLSMEKQVAEADPNDKDLQANYAKMQKGQATWVR